MATQQIVTLTPSQQSRFDGFLESRRGGVKFRRSDIADLLFETTRPKDHHRSMALAEAAIAQAAAQKLIERSGKLHWVFVERLRKTKIGPVAELLNVVEVKISTRVPEKWAFVDLESGDVYMADKKGELKKAIMETRHQVVAAIQGSVMGARVNRFNRASFTAWKRRAAGFAGMAVVVLLLLAYVVSFLKTLFLGLALVGAGYFLWVVSRKDRSAQYADAFPLDLNDKIFKSTSAARKK